MGSRFMPERNVAPNAAIAPVPGGLWGVSEWHFFLWPTQTHQGNWFSVLRRPVPQRNVAPDTAIAPVPGGLWGVSERHFLFAWAMQRE